MSRRQTERETRRRLIVDAARNLFFERGFEETSMEDIARAAEYTRRTLYAYFRSREEICLLVFIEGLQIRAEMQREAMAAAATGLAKVRAWGQAFYDFSRDHPHYLRIQLYWDYRGVAEDRIGPEVFARFHKLNEQVVGSLRDAFRLGVADGSIRPTLPVDMTISHYAYTLRSVLNKALFPAYSFARFDSDDYFRQYLDLFLQAIGNAGSRQQGG